MLKSPPKTKRNIICNRRLNMCWEITGALNYLCATDNAISQDLTANKPKIQLSTTSTRVDWHCKTLHRAEILSHSSTTTTSNYFKVNFGTIFFSSAQNMKMHFLESVALIALVVLTHESHWPNYIISTTEMLQQLYDPRKYITYKLLSCQLLKTSCLNHSLAETNIPVRRAR